MSEDQLKELLFPIKPLSAESVERDILTPLNTLTEGLNTLRQQLSLDLLKEAVELANAAEVTQRTTTIQDIRLAVLQLQESYPDLVDTLTALQTQVATVMTQFTNYLIHQEQVRELEAELLTQLHTYMTHLPR
jgi:hypothetical protein